MVRRSHDATWTEAPTDDRVALAAWMLDLGEGEVTALEHLPDQPPTLPEAPEPVHKSFCSWPTTPRLRARAHSLQLQHLEAIGLWKAEGRRNADGPLGLMARALEAAGELDKAACHDEPNRCRLRAWSRARRRWPRSHRPIMQRRTRPPDLAPHQNSNPTEDVAPEAADAAASCSGAHPGAGAGSQTEPTGGPAAAALEATSNSPSRTTTPEQDAQQGREWFNWHTTLEDKKYREALSCFDKS